MQISPLSLVLCVWGTLLVTSCAQGQQSGSSAPEADGLLDLDTPDQTLQANGQQIPVFQNFEEVESLFHREDDATYVINFWATWCKPCVEEMPYFERLHDAFPDEKLKVVLVSLDFEQQLESKLIPFLEKNKLRSDVLVLLDGNFNRWIDKVSEEWSGAIPVTLVYNAKGRSVHNNQFASYEELEDMVRGLL
jgi:thiol-disulfide isomerase/thioredoxin